MTDQAAATRDSTRQIRLGGIGGQGIVLAGRLLGKAAALFDDKEAVCTQSYGPEARGGAARADVVISDHPVDYPFVTAADVLAVLFHEAYVRYRPILRPGGTLIFDSALVQPSADDRDACGIPASRIAEDLGSRMAANVVILGYLVGLTGVVSRDSLEDAIRTTVREQHVDLDLRALDKGFRLARNDGAA